MNQKNSHTQPPGFKQDPVAQSRRSWIPSATPAPPRHRPARLSPSLSPTAASCSPPPPPQSPPHSTTTTTTTPTQWQTSRPTKTYPKPNARSPHHSHRRASTPPAPPSRTYEQHDYFGAGNDDDDEPDVERVAWTAPQPTTGFGRSRSDVDMFTTSLGWRLDYEAMFAYLMLPPCGGVFLLVMEHQSDYVRFHAWQSSLLFSFVFVIHVIFSWSSWISWVLFLEGICGCGNVGEVRGAVLWGVGE
ncbi:hypothetical protein HBH98_061650 [Parastagonospora nodorum]|nr:hypothetical protein HBI09_055670 [Parastagonospora nodorum]KAH4268465.1 hypothetical protein HBI03_055350 [Parastagonospora nodorum]KAH4278839.1 hypothetical protein HBI04_070790 [Parastagonospora nodorum]KAH4350165.1 hypothetical protein HBH98_061650 [Parastagonospora nodorum]KAH4395235.1 hypothetical protein HBH97_029470 [Parastagonospora nodorum]